MRSLSTINRVWRAFSLVVVIMAGSTLGAGVQQNLSVQEGSTKAGPAAELPLTLMCFNIRYDNPRDGEDRWEKRSQLATETILAHQPDIVGVQEALEHQLQDLLKGLPEYAFVGVGRDDGKNGGEYSAVLYRKARFAPQTSGTFWLSDTPEIPGSRSWGNRVIRICTFARLTDKPSGRSFWIYNTHLDHDSQQAREEGAKLVSARMAARDPKEPVILMGDMNAGEENAAIMYFKGRVKSGGAAPPLALLDTFRVVHADESNVGTFHGFKGTPGHFKIDYIFVEPGVRVLSAEIDRRHHNGRYPSDHFPLVATVVLP